MALYYFELVEVCTIWLNIKAPFFYINIKHSINAVLEHNRGGNI